jgi:hypothetical protein
MLHLADNRHAQLVAHHPKLGGATLTVAPADSRQKVFDGPDFRR